MASNAVLNIRLPEELKNHGNQVLERNDISVSQVVRDLYRFMEREQEVPSFAKADAAPDKFENRRKVLQDLKSNIDIPKDFDIKKMRSERIMDRYGKQ